MLMLYEQLSPDVKSIVDQDEIEWFLSLSGFNQSLSAAEGNIWREQ